jgi:uncharacterized protein YjbJ (UPF0337 family)
MGDTGERVSNAAQQAKGKAQETAGRVLSDEELEAEGQVDQAEADVQEAAQKAEDRARDAG